jgi:GNAT superfamily N-acetyltransferase
VSNSGTGPATVIDVLTLAADAVPVRRPAGRLPYGYTVRPPVRDDTEALGRLYYGAYDPGVASDTEEEAIEDIRLTFDGGYGPLWTAASGVVVHSGELVAALLVVHRAPWPDTPDCPFVVELFTARGHRRLGLARALVAGCLALVATTDRPLLALRVDERNVPARRLYASLGFTRWSGRSAENGA